MGQLMMPYLLVHERHGAMEFDLLPPLGHMTRALCTLVGLKLKMGCFY